MRASAFSACSSTAAVSGSVSAIGFSQKMGNPASMQRCSAGACISVASETKTASGPESMASSMVPAVPPTSRTSFSARSTVRLPTTISSTSGNSFSTLARKEPIRPAPRTATFIGTNLLYLDQRVSLEIDGRHPEIGVKSIIQDILDDEDLVRPLHSRLEKIPKRYFLDVREDTSLEDIKHGYQVIKGLHGSRRNKSGAPARDPLIAVQCAALYEDRRAA